MEVDRWESNTKKRNNKRITVNIGSQRGWWKVSSRFVDVGYR